MSFIPDDFGGYGSGSLGNVTDPTSSYINAYAAVQEIKTFSILVTPISNSIFHSWNNCVGCQLLVHAVAAKNSNRASLGCFAVATITALTQEDDGLRLTLDSDYAIIPQDVESGAFWQAILIPEFNNLTLQTKSLKPVQFALNNTPIDSPNSILAPCGGLLVFKCKNTLTLAGAHVDLRNAGLPLDIDSAYRSNFTHETYGTLDTDAYSGAENSIAREHLALNVGDGACLIMAKNIVTSSDSSRIGNPSTDGVQYCRGASDSTGTPQGVSNLGGSSIFVACDSWSGFTSAQIAKYRSGEGRGLARAYIAVNAPGNSFLPDEGLYALDCLQNKKRPKEQFNLSGFGNGSDGTYNLASYTPQKCWNSYAKVTAISGRVYTISRVAADVEEFTDFTVGRLVMIHQSRINSATDYTDGNFKFSRITAISGNTVTIKHNLSFNLSTYNVQMIVVPEFNNLTLGTEYNNALKWANGCGGIFAIAVNDSCNLSDAIINMENKGNSSAVVNPILGNYFMKRSLPLGKGHGSVLIIAKNLTLNSATRLAATYDGSPLSGFTNYGTARSGESLGNEQGSHILIISDNITGLNVSAISTGGDEAGAGYRNTDGVSGAAFIYCNNSTNQNTANLILS